MNGSPTASPTKTPAVAEAAPRLRPGEVGCDVPNDPNSCVGLQPPSLPYLPADDPSAGSAARVVSPRAEVEFLPMGRRLLQARLRGQMLAQQ